MAIRLDWFQRSVSVFAAVLFTAAAVAVSTPVLPIA